MKKLAIHRVVALAADLAIGGIATDAFARGGGGHGGGGGGAHGSAGAHGGVAGGSRGVALGGSGFGHSSRWGWVSYQNREKRWSGW